MESNIALIEEATDLFHRMIVLDLTMKTLEIDKTKLSALKINKPFIHWYEKQISAIWSETKELKKKLSSLGGKGDLNAVKDGDIQIYTLLFRGSNYNKRYLNIALKNHVENEISKRLGVDYVPNPYKNT